MFSLRQDRLLLNLRGVQAFHPLPTAQERGVFSLLDGARREDWIRRAENALRAPLLAVSASGLTQRDPEALRIRNDRREQLKAVTLGVCARGDDRYLDRAGDLVSLICCEMDWNDPGDSFPEEPAPVRDLSGAQTAELLATVSAVLGRVLSRPARLIRRSVAARLSDELAMGEGSLPLPGTNRPSYLRALLTALLLTEQEDRRCWLALRRILPALERAVNDLPASGCRAGLEQHLRDMLSLNDCFALISEATGGEVELRDDERFVSMAQTFPALHVCAGWFVNPGGEAALANLSPEDLYRLGIGARVRSVCALAAALERLQDRADRSDASAPLMRQIFHGLYRTKLLEEPARAAREPLCVIRGMGFIARRENDFYAALTGGGSEGGFSNAGEFWLFDRDQPVLIAGSAPEASHHSVAEVNGFAPRPGGQGGDPQFSRAAGYSLISLDLTAAYPAQACVSNWERSVMLYPDEGGARLLDVFDLEQAATPCRFRFITPLTPRIVADAVYLGGDMMLQWEQEMEARAEIFETGSSGRLWRVELSARQPAAHGRYAFTFQRIPAGQ